MNVKVSKPKDTQFKRILIDIEANTKLNILAAQLGMPKIRLLERISRLSKEELKKVLKI